MEKGVVPVQESTDTVKKEEFVVDRFINMGRSFGDIKESGSNRRIKI
jgi:hypothetical protein